MDGIVINDVDVVEVVAHSPSIGSHDLPLPPLGVENVKIRKNSEKIRGPPTTLFRVLGAPRALLKSKILTNLLRRRVR